MEWEWNILTMELIMRLKQIRSPGRHKIDLNCIFSQFSNIEAKEIHLNPVLYESWAEIWMAWASDDLKTFLGKTGGFPGGTSGKEPCLPMQET